MRRFLRLKLHSKGAAFAEYMPLLAIIGVVVIFAVVQFSGVLEDTFDRTTTIISEETTDPGVTPPGGGPDTDPDLPDIPVFPPPVGPGTGVEHIFIYDAYLEYDNQTTWSYDVMAEQADAGGQYYPDPGNPGPAAPAGWFANVTWTSVERNPYGTFSFNEVAFTTTEFTHNIGPLPGWGDNPTSVQSCLDNFPQDQQYFIRGRLPSGDAIRLIVNITPESCIPTAVYNFSHNYVLQHDSGVGFDYGDLSNALAAADGITGVDFNDVPTWILTDSYIQGPETGNTFNAVSIGTQSMSINLAVANEAYDVCNETTQMYATVFGVLPNGDGVSLQINVEAYTGPDPNCFVPFGGP